MNAPQTNTTKYVARTLSVSQFSTMLRVAAISQQHNPTTSPFLANGTRTAVVLARLNKRAIPMTSLSGSRTYRRPGRLGAAACSPQRHATSTETISDEDTGIAFTHRRAAAGAGAPLRAPGVSIPRPVSGIAVTKTLLCSRWPRGRRGWPTHAGPRCTWSAPRTGHYGREPDAMRAGQR